MKKIIATVARGKYRGTALKPHLYKSGHYLVAKHGNTLDCSKKVYDANELKGWIDRGYSIRMSGKNVPPSLISPKTLIVIH